ncbi:MAG: chemotaxis protein CheB [Syntrophobacteraceae bacterium]|jgi:two-component system chemotaxis response regulator CheB
MIAADRASVSNPVKTLIVDDAPFMRKAVQAILGNSDMIEVVGTASNGQECLSRIAERRPDVITLDIDMPVMNGISTVKNIMVRYQIPIVIISSLVQDGYFAFEALRLGVMDFIPKPSKVGQMNWADEEELIRKRVLTAAGMQVHRMRRVRCKHKHGPVKSDPRTRPTGAVVMGTTLAGPNTIMHLVTALPANFNSVIIALQEIHPRILAPFCSYFNQISPMEVIPVTSACPLLPGRVYIGSTFSALSVESSKDGPSELEVRATPNGKFPIDRLFSSAAHHFGQRTCGVLLTGIGTDGADGMGHIKAEGGLTIAQEKSCCPYPNLVENVIEKGIVDAILSTQGIVNRLKSWTDHLNRL